jgi:AcrR family transcriptional regulator
MSVTPQPLHAAVVTRPMRADARRNRERVLGAAKQCFARDGADAQMDDVANAAGVGVGTVYRHFATKDALVRALADEHFALETEIARAALEIEDPWEAFCTFMREGAELFAANRALAQFTADRPDVMKDAALACDLELGFFDTVDELISRAQRAHALRSDFELEDVPAIMCALGGLQVSRGAYANWRRVFEFVLEGLHVAGDTATLPPVGERLPRAQR